ncbi:MAG TPA: TonB-dependent receptor [Vicinamibacterales bacterium]|nr:TonB-dependent receptor [Vicinamibacterales bacterium]
MTLFTARAVLSLSLLSVPAFAAAQTSTAPSTQDDPLLRVGLPTVTVTAQKEPEEIQKLPLSVTAVSKEMIESAGVRIPSDAAIFSPNTYFTEFSARKLSNARIRGIGASPNNPAITTVIDGVPQLNANSSSLELLDVQQIEFVRGPQSVLFGRNTLGGVINVTSARPSFEKWSGGLSVPFGNFASFDIRGHASGALIADKLSAGAAFTFGTRDGYTLNDVTGDDLDSRSALNAKGQLLWLPAKDWEARVIVTAERAEDGDYALNDLAALRDNPHHSSRDFEGYTDRNIFGTTIQTQRKGSRFNLSTTTGFVRWTTEDATDLDYSPMPLVTRLNAEEDFQFTQEVRVASTRPTKLNDQTTVRWQSGVFLFTQNYQQDAANTIAPFVLSPFVSVPVKQYSPIADLNDFGFGVFGQGTATFRDNLDVVAGLRVDYESKNADLKTFYDPAIAPPTVVDTDDSFANVAPQIAVAYRLQPNRTVYGTFAGGYKAGGFNPASPAGSEAFAEERSWSYEGGYKSIYFNGRMSFSAALFFIDWNDLQLNVPNVNVPGQLYIANVGGASSKGFELEAAARPIAGVDVYGTFGYTNARFSNGTTALGVDVSDNKVPNTPEFTTSVGVQYGKALSVGTVYGRADLGVYGSFKYDEANSEGQDAYALVNLRGGFRRKIFFAEAWMKNAFDTTYIPVAFAYGPLAPSGFIGENGAPRTFGLSAGFTF